MTAEESVPVSGAEAKCIWRMAEGGEALRPGLG